MIKVKSATNETKEITKIFVKTGATTTSQIAEAYQVYDNGGTKALRKVFGYSTTPQAPTITSISESEGSIYVEATSSDTLQYRYTEYAGNGAEIYTSDWDTSASLSTYGCTTDVLVEVRSVRGDLISEVVSDYYTMERGTFHDYGYTYISTGALGGAYGRHEVSCSICGEYLYTEECTEEGATGYCQHCGETTA